MPMKIAVEVELSADNEIQFFDACKAVSDVLTELGEKALQNGEVPNVGDEHEVREPQDDEVIGFVRVLA